MTDRIRVVLDTNVIVSAALAEHSVPRKVIVYILRYATLLISDEVFSEIEEILGRRKFDKYIQLEDRVLFFQTIAKESEIIHTKSVISDCKDPKDNKFLELAVDGSATVIITGDTDLLALHPYRGIDIISPSEFAKRLQIV